MQPILADLPLTQERITFAEIRENVRTATPFKQSRNAFIASVFASFAAVAAAYSHYAAKPGLDAHVLVWAFNAVLWGSLAFVWYRRASRKATESSDATRFVRLSRLVLGIAVLVLVAFSAGLQIYRKHLVPTARDYAMARVQLEAAAKASDAKAMNGLGWLYQTGLGGTQDYARAQEWYVKAANAGNAAAMSNLASLYQRGLGVPQNYAKARAVFDKAAKAGFGPSMDALGVIYINGWGSRKAMRWLASGTRRQRPPEIRQECSTLRAFWILEGAARPILTRAHLLLQSASLGHKWSVTVLDEPLKFLTPSTRIELKREFARRRDYRGALDGTWDKTARTAATAYLDNSQ